MSKTLVLATRNVKYTVVIPLNSFSVTLFYIYIIIMYTHYIYIKE